MDETGVAWTNIVLELGGSPLRMAGFRMSPTVPPTSMMAISVSLIIVIAVETAFDLIGDVGDDLYRTSAKVSAAFFLSERSSKPYR